MKIRCERFKSLALAILLAIGAGLVWGFLASWGSSVVSEIASSHNVYERLEFLQDGTPIIGSYGGDYRLTAFRTLDGKKVEAPDEGFDGGAYLAGPKNQAKPFTGLRWNERIFCVRNDWRNPEVWYFIHDGKLDGRAHFVIYDKISKSIIGYVGRNGFRTNKPLLDQQFCVDGRKLSYRYGYGGAAMINSWYNADNEVKYLLTNDGLTEINFKKRSVANLRKDSHLLSGTRSTLPCSAEEEKTAKSKPVQTILLRTPDKVLILALDGKKIGEYSLPQELREETLQWIPLPGKKALAYRNLSPSGNAELFWLDTTGKTVRHELVELLNPRQSELMSNINGSIVIPCPGLLAGVVACYPWGVADCPESLEYSAALSKAFAKGWPFLLITCITSTILACVCYRRQRKYGLPWTWMWTAFVLLFGLPAFFGYLAYRAWPARLPCPHCGRRVPRDRPNCFACGHDFPHPAAKGIEVFA